MADDQKKEHPTQDHPRVSPTKDDFQLDPITARRDHNDPNDPREDQPQNAQEAALADPSGFFSKKHRA